MQQRINTFLQKFYVMNGISNMSAILEMYLGGQGAGEACDQLLFGEVNPSGRLAETFSYQLEDNPSYLYYPGDGKKAVYGEGIIVGYRYYDKKKQPVRWAFGHGLSYTDFEYGNLRFSSADMDDNSILKIQVDVINIGTAAGKEVIQLYIADENNTLGRPEKELKGFTKLELNPGETKTAVFKIQSRNLAYYHEELGDWYAPAGRYRVLIGHASGDIRLTAEIRFETKRVLPFRVDASTSIGELFKNEKTAGIVSEILEMLSVAAGQEEKSEENEEKSTMAMRKAMLEGTPLKSLVSFGIPGEKVESIIREMNQ